MFKKVSMIAALLAIVAGGALTSQSMGLPPDEAGALGRLAASPRHGEWVSYEAGGMDKVDAYLVYPERRDKAPVVIVIHEIFGLSDWVRSVADQFAADGFIAIAPDFLSGKGPEGRGSRGVNADGARALIATVTMDEVMRRIEGAARYASSLPAASGTYGVVGYCWGGGVSFGYATLDPKLGAAVVFYGTSPQTDSLASVQAPILGHYGGNDARVNATIPTAEAELKRLGKSFEYAIYEGAGHGFLRQQSGQNGANLKASEAAWPRTIAFLKEKLGDDMGVDSSSGASSSLAPSALQVLALAGGLADGHADGHAGAEDDCDGLCFLPSLALAK